MACEEPVAVLSSGGTCAAAMMTQLVLCHLCGRPSLSSCFLVLAPPTSSAGKDLGSRAVVGILRLCFCFSHSLLLRQILNCKKQKIPMFDFNKINIKTSCAKKKLDDIVNSCSIFLASESLSLFSRNCFQCLWQCAKQSYHF